MENALVFAFNYEGIEITFESNGEIKVNATEMAKSFEKRPVDWLRSEPTKRFLDELGKVRNLHFDNLVTTKQGGNNPGTWFHEDVALEFARWLSPKFAIWCNDRIKELAKYGFTATPRTLDEMISNPDLVIGLATQLKEERKQKELALKKVELQSEQLNIAAPKVQYHDEVLQAENTHTSTTIAKELGMSAQNMHQLLHKRGIMFFHENHWVLYAPYQGKGYTKTRTHSYEKMEDGKKIKVTNMITVWTEKGREFIHRTLKSYKAA